LPVTAVPMVRADDCLDGAQTASAHAALLDALAAGEHPPAVIVVGTGEGQMLENIVRRLPATNVVVLEPSLEAARRLLAHSAVVRKIEQGHLLLLVGPTYGGATDAWKLLGKISGMPPLFVDPALEQERPDDAAVAKLAAARMVLGAVQNDQARRRFAGRYLLNTLTNLPVIATESDVTSLFDAFPGMPAVVVAAGPSLDRNIAELKTLENRVLIVAVDTAVRALVAADIRPHLVVSADPSEANARHLNDLPNASGMWLVAEGSVHPTVLPQFAGRMFAFKVSNHHPWPWLAAHRAERGTLQAWGSVLTTAFDLACRMGCGPIVFAGADLAYTNRLLYCRNTAYESDWSHLPTDEARVELFDRVYFPNHETSLHADVDGREVLTAPRFIQFRDWLVARADAAGDRRIVNATGGGILYGGRIDQSDLTTVLAQHPPVDEASPISGRLAQAWHKGIAQGVEAGVRRGLDRVLQRHDKPHDQLAAWADFGKDTVTLDEIASRTLFALRGIDNIHRGRSSRWAEDVAELMQTVELTRQLHIAERERDEARSARDSALAERDIAVQARSQAERERNEAAVAAFLGHYSSWRTHRLRVLMDLWGRHNFRDATVLELACGHGDIGAFFLSLGADVTFVDAREEHLAVVRTRYPDATTVLHDANHPLQPPKGSAYDYVVHMGLLYHLRPDAVAASLANVCTLGRHVVLETEVCDSDDPSMIIATCESGFDQAVDGVGSRPSSAFIERTLNGCGVRWQRHDDPRLNTGFHIYDWEPLNNGRYFEPNAARADPSAMQQVLRRFYTIETTR
jgi:2-polyprenyl-3-methyl-5-hydroxy-6-metoxy-1,4-benzoquinol methylase